MKLSRAKELFHIWAMSQWGEGKKGQSSGVAPPSNFFLSPHFLRSPNAKKLFFMARETRSSQGNTCYEG